MDISNTDITQTYISITVLHCLIGYIENDSNKTLTLCQDDATKNFHLTIGKNWYYGSSLQEVFSKAVEAEKKNWD